MRLGHRIELNYFECNIFVMKRRVYRINVTKDRGIKKGSLEKHRR